MLYPQPYLGQVLRGIPIAVVDQDRTELSRELVQTLNADEAVKVSRSRGYAGRGAGGAWAPRGVRDRRHSEDTEREVLKGKKARIAAYVDFGLFPSLQPHAGRESPRRQAPFRARSQRVGRGRRQPRPCRADPQFAGRACREPLFNPTGGYASYVVPAAFVLILQQTLS